MSTRSVSSLDSGLIYTADMKFSSVTRYIVGYKKEESDYLLKFLYDHIALSQDTQVRLRWKAGTVVVWDVSYKNQFVT